MSAVPAPPPARPHPRPRPRAPGSSRKAPWGWLELAGVAQYAMPALMFLPFVVGPMRTASRVAGFGVALLAWAAVAASGRREVGQPFAARPWLIVTAAWMLLNVAHPLSNSLPSAAAEALLVIAVFSPGLWVGRLVVTPRRLGRLLVLIFLVCSASTVVGIAQFYYPGRFDPPNFMIEEVVGEEVFGGYFYETSDGRRVMRPCGLTDKPGGAAGTGSIAFLLGIGLALRPGARWWQRLPCLPLAAAGMAIMYFSQVRQKLIVTVLSLVLMAALFALRGEVRRVLKIAAAGGLLFAVGLLWALRAGGDAVVGRFRALFEGGSAAEVYYANRGHFVESALTRWLPEYPLGAGLGRWGMCYAYFGQSRPAGSPGSSLYAEENITAWVFQGGLVMLVLAFGAMTTAMLSMVRVARTTPDRDLANSAAVCTAVCAGLLTQVFGSLPFVAPVGLVFWLLAAALHAADQQVRVEHRRARQASAARGGPGPAAAAPQRVGGRAR